MSDFKYQKLKELRKTYGYTQADVAKKIEIARTTYADYEKGRILPPIDKIKRLCALFSLQLSDLTDIKDDVKEMDKSSTEYMMYKRQKMDARNNIATLNRIFNEVNNAPFEQAEKELLNSAIKLLYNKYAVLAGADND